MRIERATTVSWIPSDSPSGMLKAGEKLRFAHHDEPPPDRIGSPAQPLLEELRDADRFRFANLLRAWVEVEDGAIVASGYSGGGHMGSTTVSLGVVDVTIAALAYPDLPCEPEVGEGWVRFRQTTGGRTGMPIPRPVKRAPFFQFTSPTVWTTLDLTIWADGRHEGRLVGASGFPRHWVYDDAGALIAKSGLTDLKSWLNTSFGQQTPWGTHDAEVLVTEVETALERELSTQLMRSGAADVIRLREGDLVANGRAGDVGARAPRRRARGRGRRSRGGRARPRRRRGERRPRGWRAHGHAGVPPGPHRGRQPGRRRPSAPARPRRRSPPRGRGQRWLSGRGGAAAVGWPGRRCHCGRERRRSLTRIRIVLAEDNAPRVTASGAS
jgi:hypothetical protein